MYRGVTETIWLYIEEFKVENTKIRIDQIYVNSGVYTCLDDR